MKHYLYLLPLFIMACNSSPKEEIATALTYPETRTTDHTDHYFGTDVNDPFRWLEDDNSEETKNWVNAQNEVTQNYLEQIPYRGKLKDRLLELENYEKVSAPFKRSGNFYLYKNNGLQNQSVLYTSKTLDENPQLLLDPNTFSEDGTISLAGTSWSHDGKYMNYSVSISGSDWREIYIMDMETKQLLKDTVKWAKFTATPWHHDGFFYQRFDTPEEGDALTGANQFGKIYYHKAGTPQAEDELIYENPENPEERFGVDVSDDEQFLVLYSYTSTSGNSLRIKDLKNNGEWITIVDDFESEHSVVFNEGNTLYIETTLDAPNRRLVKVSSENPSPENWADVIPENDHVLSVSTAGGNFFANYLIDAKTSVHQFDLEGNMIREIELPGIGTASGFSAGRQEEELFYTFRSFTVPPSVYKYNIETGESTLHQKPEMNFNIDDYETKQVFFESHDGTKIPMFITHKKGLPLNGKNPTWLYSYGGFNISLRPSFNAQRMLWLENGGVYAMPNIRGGGEYGEEWHEAGTKLKKKNVFKDFIAAAEYLIAEKYTSSEYLALEGGSNGGLLIGATINMAPGLAKVAFPRVGVMDMLRYQHFTIGRAWSTDYGTSEDSEEMFQYLYSYSPLHNIKKIEYPATMVMTADHDDRVVPAHSFKYGATLQSKQQGNNPVLMRIESKAGHGAGTPISKRVEQTADMYSFTWYNMGVVPEIAKEDL